MKVNARPEQEVYRIKRQLTADCEQIIGFARQFGV
jgi:hypothetical protein